MVAGANLAVWIWHFSIVNYCNASAGGLFQRILALNITTLVHIVFGSEPSFAHRTLRIQLIWYSFIHRNWFICLHLVSVSYIIDVCCVVLWQVAYRVNTYKCFNLIQSGSKTNTNRRNVKSIAFFFNLTWPVMEVISVHFLHLNQYLKVVMLILPITTN